MDARRLKFATPDPTILPLGRLRNWVAPRRRSAARKLHGNVLYGRRDDADEERLTLTSIGV